MSNLADREAALGAAQNYVGQIIRAPKTAELIATLYRRQIVRGELRPGDTLLIVAHHPADAHVNIGRPGHVDRFPSAGQLAAALDPGNWEILVATATGRPATGLDGQPVTVKDTVLRARRR